MEGVRLAVCAVLLGALAGCGPAGPHRSVRIAAAADLRFALEEVLAEFRRSHPEISVPVSYGSSGSFYAQIRNRAPFDLYLAADNMYPLRLKEAGLTLEGSEFVYGVGRIVLWVPRSSLLDVEHQGMAALTQPGVQRVAIANPQHAPYGRAAEEAMRFLGIYDAVREKLVFGENVAQTLQFVQSGAAQAGIVALALALAPEVKAAGKYWEVPLDAYSRLEQGGAILKRAEDPAAARQLRDFLLTGEGKAVLKRYGFYLPGE